MADEEIDILGALNGEDESTVVGIAATTSTEVGVSKLVDPKIELCRKIGNILAEHGMLESNIPVTHEYWSLIGRLRVM